MSLHWYLLSAGVIQQLVKQQKYERREDLTGCVFIFAPLNVHIPINGLILCRSQEFYAPLPMDMYIVPSGSLGSSRFSTLLQNSRLTAIHDL